MTGRDVEYAFPERPARRADRRRRPCSRSKGWPAPGEFEPLDLELRAGEIVGLAGLVGSGRSEILETVYGARRPTAGRVLRRRASRCAPAASAPPCAPGSASPPRSARRRRLLMLESVTRNVSVSSLSRFSRGGWIDRGAERAAARAAVRDLSLRPDDPERPVRTLSGGNQQKAVLARWLLRGCRVLLLDEPTRGVDVGARAELYAVDPPARRRRRGRPARLQRSARGPRPRRPGAGAPRGPRRAHGARPGAGRTPRPRPRHGREPVVMTQPAPPPRDGAGPRTAAGRRTAPADGAAVHAPAPTCATSRWSACSPC